MITDKTFLHHCMDCGASACTPHHRDCASHERGDGMNRSEAVQRLHAELSEWPKPSTLRAEVLEIPGWRWEVRGAKATLERRDAAGFVDVITETDWRANYYHFKHAERMSDAWSEGEERIDRIAQSDASGDHYADPVNHPDHYQSADGIECIDAIRAALGLEGFVAHCRGTAIKYAWRSGKKQKHAEDLRKAAWYLTRAAEAMEDDA